MAMERVVILGAGGSAREVLGIFDDANRRKDTYDVVGFVIDPEYGKPGTIINDRPVLGGFDWLEKHRTNVSAVCAVGDSELRYRMVQRAIGIGVRFCTIIHPETKLSKWVSVGEGSVIAAGTILTTQVTIGNHVHVNLDCTIHHDAVIEDFVTLSPGVHVTGNVTLREGCFIGTGANFVPKTTVGSWAIVGAGSAVVSNIPPNTTAVGVPAKVIKTRIDGWHLSP